VATLPSEAPGHLQALGLCIGKPRISDPQGFSMSQRSEGVGTQNLHPQCVIWRIGNCFPSYYWIPIDVAAGWACAHTTYTHTTHTTCMRAHAHTHTTHTHYTTHTHTHTKCTIISHSRWPLEFLVKYKMWKLVDFVLRKLSFKIALIEDRFRSCTV